MKKIEYFYKYLPENSINWELIKEEILFPYVDKLNSTMQELKWHGEGNVLNHTIMVCEELIKLEEYKNLCKLDKLIVFLSALFHDIGKITCTKEIAGEITSYHHGPAGAVMLREYLWKDYGLCGNKFYQEFREAICLLVKYHSVPIHNDENLIKTVIKLSLNSKLTKFFKLELLAVLARADVLGIIGNEYKLHLENIDFFIEQAKELNCFNQEFKFNDSYTKYQYLNSDNIWHYQELFNKNYGTVILICGLPGTGKDTYIRANYNLPVISLDEIREEFNISPKDNQSKVYEIAKERAKELLRNKKEFIWNATNLTNLIRNKQLNLFHNYNASVKIIFLETDLETNLCRNKNREKEVDTNVIYKLLGSINIPEEFEAEEVEWKVV